MAALVLFAASTSIACALAFDRAGVRMADERAYVAPTPPACSLLTVSALDPGECNLLTISSSINTLQETP